MAHQVTHPLCVGSEGVGVFLRELLSPRGLEIRVPEPLPWFPPDLDAPIALDCGGLNPRFNVTLDHEVVLPLVLVFDCKVRSAQGYVYQATPSVKPYYIHPVLVLPDGVPNLAEWRRLNTIEAVSCLAENPWLGHLTYWSENCTMGVCVAYFHRGHIKVQCALERGRNYNAAYTRWANNSPEIKMRRSGI